MSDDDDDQILLMLPTLMADGTRFATTALMCTAIKLLADGRLYEVRALVDGLMTKTGKSILELDEPLRAAKTYLDRLVEEMPEAAASAAPAMKLLEPMIDGPSAFAGMRKLAWPEVDPPAKDPV